MINHLGIATFRNVYIGMLRNLYYTNKFRKKHFVTKLSGVVKNCCCCSKEVIQVATPSCCVICHFNQNTSDAFESAKNTWVSATFLQGKLSFSQQV